MIIELDEHELFYVSYLVRKHLRGVDEMTGTTYGSDRESLIDEVNVCEGILIKLGQDDE